MNSSPWLVPDWPAPPGVQALCSTREGGVSGGCYAGLNLGGHVGDEPVHVQANRALFRARLNARPVFLEQIHGTRVAALGAQTEDGMSADACTTTERGIACTIMVADCLPVLFTDASGARVGAAHAGWRGLAAGVLERTVDAFRASDGTSEILAWLGPCIGPDAFEVGDEVRAAFESALPSARACFRPSGAPGKWMADLAGLARQRLAAAGVTRAWGNDGSEAWCTVHNPLLFFSHRRDRISGRFAACIWRD
ncbi:MAG TPA: peptidoglycan editing factor PgeF [Variovorax sp.]